MRRLGRAITLLTYARVLTNNVQLYRRHQTQRRAEGKASALVVTSFPLH